MKHSPLEWKKDQVILLAIFWSVVGMYVIILLSVIHSITYALPASRQYLECINSDEEVAEFTLTLSNFVVVASLSLMICSSIGMDIFCLYKLHHEEAVIEETNRKHQLDKLKVRWKAIESTEENIEQNQDSLKKPELVLSAQEFLKEQEKRPGLKSKNVRRRASVAVPMAPEKEQINLAQALDFIGKLALEDQHDRNEVLTAEKADGPSMPEPLPDQRRVKKILNELPVRSTLLNTLFLIPYLIIMAALGNISDDFSEKDKRYILGLPYLILTVGRTWFVATCTFKVNDSNRKKDLDVEREKRRQEEIKEALEKRRQRQSGME